MAHSAQRDADLFRCAISIAGPSDLGMLISEESRYLNMAEVVQKQIGTDKEKIRRDSPRLHASEVTIPVLLIQGDRDAQVWSNHNRWTLRLHALVRLTGSS